MQACYPSQARNSYNRPVPGCTGAAVPEDPARLTGPEVGFAIYHSKYEEGDVVVRVIERSYVWSPELHGPNGHGYRRYDWSVIERGPNRYRTVVVNDTDLSPLPSGSNVTAVWALR